MVKEFLSYQVMRNNAIKLSQKIHQDGFIPDIIYVNLRGGAYLGNIISEYYKIIRRDQRPVLYAAVVVRSYSNLHQEESIRVDGWTYNPEYLRHGDKILLIDDIFDSGRTINHLVRIFLEKGIPRNDLRIAVHDYKIKQYLAEQPAIQPDYWCRKQVINTPDDDIWVHYLSHELIGLSEAEILQYYGDDPEVVKQLLRLQKTNI